MFASDYRDIARQKLKGNWGIAILVCFLAAVLGGSIGFSGINIEIDAEDLKKMPDAVQRLAAVLASVGGFHSLLRIVFGGPIQLGNCRYHLNQHDGLKKDVADLFHSFAHWGNAFLLSLLTAIFQFLWTLLFIFPGIMARYRYAMAPYIMEENPGMTAMEAIDASKKLMDGHKWELFCLDISFIGWVILSAFTFGIGDLFLSPYTSAAHTAFYRNLVPRNAAATAENYEIPPVEF